MSTRKKYPGGLDDTYGREHRAKLPQIYDRHGHRLNLADRDWTEYCHYCRTPLLICEEVRDVGQNLSEKSTTITRRLAERATLPAELFAWRVERPPEVEARLAELNAEIEQLQSAYPIVGFRARTLWPRSGGVVQLEPKQWWEHVALTHAKHHRHCENKSAPAVKDSTIRKLQSRDPLVANAKPYQFGMFRTDRLP